MCHAAAPGKTPRDPVRKSSGLLGLVVMGTGLFNEIVTASPGESANHRAYTGEIVASTPIKRVSAKKPPKKNAIFAMSTPESRHCSTPAAREATRAVILGWGSGSLQGHLRQESTDQTRAPRPAPGSLNAINLGLERGARSEKLNEVNR